MTKTEMLHTLKPTTQECIDFIVNEGTPTGSVVYGVDTMHSDVDIIIPPNSTISFQEILDIHNGSHTNQYGDADFTAIYVLISNTLYNLLFMKNDNIFQSWVNATRLMLLKSIISKNYNWKIKNKQIRVAYFEDYLEKYNNAT